MMNLLYLLACIAYLGQTTATESCVLPCPFREFCCIGCDGPFCANVTSTSQCPRFFCPIQLPNCGWLHCDSTQVCCNGDYSNPACVQRGQACTRPIPRCNSSSDCGTREICCPGPNCLNAHCLGAGLMCPADCVAPSTTPAPTPAPAPVPNCGWLTCDTSTQRCCNADYSNPACVPKGALCVRPVPRCNSTSTCGYGTRCCPGGGCLNSRCINQGQACPFVCAGSTP